MPAHSWTQPGPRRQALLLAAGALACLTAAGVVLARPAEGTRMQVRPLGEVGSASEAQPGVPPGADLSGVRPPTDPAAAGASGSGAPTAGDSGSEGHIGVRRETGFLPTQVSLPRLGLRAEVAPVRVGADGALAVPEHPEVLGWWAEGARPGSGTGTVVLDGHLDSRRYGTGPLAQIGRLRAGDRLIVAGTAGQRLSYHVTAVRSYPKSSLPVAEVFSQNGPERLVLVTCGGRYRPGAGGWDSNVVVYLAPLAPGSA